ncbi:hypothetical protein CBL_12357 [Carabus blaptoides fortunei]
MEIFGVGTDSDVLCVFGWMPDHERIRTINVVPDTLLLACTARIFAARSVYDIVQLNNAYPEYI